ncbi:hypothetical protein [Streptomyces sp. NPDC058953]|uniref:hypothetical protein n=1 Tax=unclassified Streptomyces TaxID=2593676 RepID=UPI003692CE70
MKRSRIGVYALRPPGRIVLLVGLVALIVVHLAGAVHREGSSDAHLPLAWGSCLHSVDVGDPSGPHDHGHGGDDHLDHDADRTRVAVDSGDLSAAATVAALDADTASVSPAPCPGACSSAPSGGTEGRSTLVRHCVLRQ